MLIAAFALAAATPTPLSERSPQAAVQVVRDYYAAVQRHDYRTAYAIWSGGKSFAAFRRGYAGTARVTMTPLPPFRIEGAAGSAFVDVNVRIDARRTDGRAQHFSGSYTLRRVNDVDGASAAQRRWQIVSARLRAVPAGL